MIRTRLTIWNCTVLTLVLAVIGAAIYFTTRQSILASVDQSLQQRASLFAREWHGFPEMLPPGPHGETAGKPFPVQSPSMDMEAARKEGIDPHQLRQIQAMSLALRPMIAKLDGTDIMFEDRKLWDLDGFQRAKAGLPTFGNANVEGIPLRIYSQPLFQNGGVVAVSQMASPMVLERQELARLARTLEIVLPLAVFVMLITGVVLTRTALRPISDLASAAETIEAANLHGRLPVEGEDEFAHLSSTFNRMLGRLEVAFSEKDEAYARQRRFTADASHELKTPLTAICARTEIALRRDLEPEQYRDHLHAIGRAASLMSSVVNSLLLLAASDEGRLKLHPERISVRELVDDAWASVDVSRHETFTEIEGDPAVVVDPAAFTRLLVNLVENAVRHTPEGSPIEIAAHPLGEGLRFTVRDEGCGIPADHVPLVFNRFHRVGSARDRASGGSGLGLAIAKAIVEAHGGSISLQSEEGLGTTVTIDLPARTLSPQSL